MQPSLVWRQQGCRCALNASSRHRADPATYARPSDRSFHPAAAVLPCCSRQKSPCTWRWTLLVRRHEDNTVRWPPTSGTHLWEMVCRESHFVGSLQPSAVHDVGIQGRQPHGHRRCSRFHALVGRPGKCHCGAMIRGDCASANMAPAWFAARHRVVAHKLCTRRTHSRNGGCTQRAGSCARHSLN